MTAETPRSAQHSGIALFSAGATAIEVLRGSACAWVFFIWTVETGLESGSGMCATRAVSFFGPDESASGRIATGGGADGAAKTSGEVRTCAAGFETSGGSVGVRGGRSSANGRNRCGESDGWRRPSWTRTVSRDFVSWPGDFNPDCGGRSMRTVCSFGSFESAIGVE